MSVETISVKWDQQADVVVLGYGGAGEWAAKEKPW